MTIVKNSATAALADDLIGAAQTLETEAKRLKQAAKHIRTEGLTQWDETDVCDNQRMHKSHDIKNAAVRALQALKPLSACYLVEHEMNPTGGEA